MTEEEWNEWGKWVKENYDPSKPITIGLPYRHGLLQLEVSIDGAMAVLAKLSEGKAE